MNKNKNEPVAFDASWKTLLLSAAAILVGMPILLMLEHLWFDFWFNLYKQLSPLR